MSTLQPERHNEQPIVSSMDDEKPPRVDVDIDETQHPPKVLSAFVILCAGFNICNTWTGLASTLALGISQGGPLNVVYGLVVMFFLLGASALSLAEMAARYPTAGGQYHWTAILSPQRASRYLSYACGSTNFFSWIAVCASVTLIPPQQVVGVIAYYHPEYTIQRWHVFLMYQGLNIFVVAYNTLLLRRAPWTHDIGFVLSLTSFFVITVACLAIAYPKQSNSYVWTNFVNDSGWSSDGLVFLTGLINPNFGLAGIDGAVHLAEDCANAATAVPWALVSVMLISSVSAFWFTVSMFYCISDPTAVLDTPTNVPILEIWSQATRSTAATTVFMVLLILIGFFALNGAQQTASRLTWSFARDNALIFSDYIGRIDPQLGVPVWALVFNAFVVFVLGCVFLGSSTAFNAIVGTTLVLQQLSYAFPAALLMWQRRHPRFLPPKGRFNLGAFGWVANAVTVGWAMLSLVIYSLPVSLPATSSNMNYTCAVLGGMAIFTLVNWWLHARRHYHGPRINLEKL
ncbi:MAG: hypothetical protein M1838_003165 [Thelocarpon superellum]|nr:MAG: hypothetical protein M1838_003165 [Thelocarpon superellum]